MSETLTIAGREFRSRLIVGTGKYRGFLEMQRCHEASSAAMVTVAGHSDTTDARRGLDGEGVFVRPLVFADGGEGESGD